MHLNYFVNLQGAENWRLQKLVLQNAHLEEYKLWNHIVEFKTGVLLQNIPEIIDREIKAERSENRSAIVTSGLSHMDEMYRFLDEKRIVVKPVSKEDLVKINLDIPGINDQIINLLIKGINEPLELLQQGYGITIIFPTTASEKFPFFLPEELRSK